MKMHIDDNQKKIISDLLIENLPVLRAKLNYTQADLASQLGVTRQTIINIESKKTNISWTMVLALLFIFISNPLSISLMSALGILNKNIISLLGADSIYNLFFNPK